MEEQLNGNELERFLYFLPGFGHSSSSKEHSARFPLRYLQIFMEHSLHSLTAQIFNSRTPQRRCAAVVVCVMGSMSCRCRSRAPSNYAANTPTMTLAERYFAKLRNYKQQREQKNHIPPMWNKQVQVHLLFLNVEISQSRISSSLSEIFD